MERNEAEGRVGWRGGWGRRCRADGEELVEQQVEGDDGQVEVEPEQLYEHFNGPLNLFVLTMYDVHVARRMSDGAVRLYTFSLLCCVFHIN